MHYKITDGRFNPCSDIPKYICHISDMKTIQIASAALVCVLGAMPIAQASPQSSNEGDIFRISVTGDELPARMGELDYPYTAASRGQSGACDLTVVLQRDGQRASHSVDQCTSAQFERTANEFARTLAFQPKAAGDEDVRRLTIKWSAD